MSNNIGIVGTDGYTPIYQPDAKWNIWNINEIYRGLQGQNKYIPKVNDYVIEPETGILYIVEDLNNLTFIPVLRPINLQVSEENKILDTITDNFRVYFDKSVSPYTLAVDNLFKVYGTSATTARIYKGYFIDNTKLISRRYDNNGNFIGHDIPLNLVLYNNHTNYAVKTIPTCNTTTEDLVDGEVVTVAIFDSNGKVLAKRLMLLEETTYVAQAYAEQKYIVQISLKSPFISNSNDNQINYPVNLPLQSFNPIGVVHYNDGSSIEYAIDNDKFRLYGLDSFVSTIIGHRIPLVLSYRLDSNESALASVTSDGTFVTRAYELIVSNPNTSYNVKLFAYPRWLNAISGYTYDVFLMNLDRNVLFNVTNLVSLSNDSPSFNPLAYGVTQRLKFRLNLSDVSGIYNNFIHLQTYDFVLRGPASDTSLNNIWEVSTQVPTTMPYYGTNLKAVRDTVNIKRIKIDNNLSLNNWLTQLYIRTQPLVNNTIELEPITPSHFEVMYNNESVIKPISEYNTYITFNNDVDLLSNVYIVFLKQTYSGYLKLSIAGLTVR